MVVETEIRKLKLEMRREIAELRRIICTRMVADKWVKQDVACVLLNVNPRRLRDLRVHLNRNGKKVGYIGWQKGNGRNVLYYLPDIEKYNSLHTIMS